MGASPNSWIWPYVACQLCDDLLSKAVVVRVRVIQPAQTKRTPDRRSVAAM